MMVYCEATVPEKAKRDNLVQCLKILRKNPNVCGTTVSVTALANEDKVVELFEQYPVHVIRASYDPYIYARYQR